MAILSHLGHILLFYSTALHEGQQVPLYMQAPCRFSFLFKTFFEAGWSIHVLDVEWPSD